MTAPWICAKCSGNTVTLFSGTEATWSQHTLKKKKKKKKKKNINPSTDATQPLTACGSNKNWTCFRLPTACVITVHPTSIATWLWRACVTNCCSRPRVTRDWLGNNENSFLRMFLWLQQRLIMLTSKWLRMSAYLILWTRIWWAIVVICKVSSLNREMRWLNQNKVLMFKRRYVMF